MGVVYEAKDPRLKRTVAISAFHDRVAAEYPQCRKQLRHSSELKRSRQVPRNGQSVSLLRQRAVRTRALSVAKQSSMGLRSGL